MRNELRLLKLLREVLVAFSLNIHIFPPMTPFLIYSKRLVIKH